MRAVQFAFAPGSAGGSVAIQRSSAAGEPYAARYTLLPLAAVAGKTRTMEDAFIAASGTDVTDTFVTDYLRPLLGAGLPGAARLRAPAVAKVLQA